MSFVTEVSMQKNKSRANIYLDGDFVCGMEISVIMKNGIKVGMEISEEKLKKLQKESDAEKAFSKALDLLDRQQYTKKQIKDKLNLKGYESEIIEDVIHRLEDYGYISDKIYAKSYVASVKGKSKRELECSLLKKGISRYNIADVLDEACIDEEQSANLVAEKFMKYKEKTQENKQKLYARLYRKGYSGDVINSVVYSWFGGEDY